MYGSADTNESLRRCERIEKKSYERLPKGLSDKDPLAILIAKSLNRIIVIINIDEQLIRINNNQSERAQRLIKERTKLKQALRTLISDTKRFERKQ